MSRNIMYSRKVNVNAFHIDGKTMKLLINNMAVVYHL